MCIYTYIHTYYDIRNSPEEIEGVGSPSIGQAILEPALDENVPREICIYIYREREIYI